MDRDQCLRKPGYAMNRVMTDPSHYHALYPTLFPAPLLSATNAPKIRLSGMALYLLRGFDSAMVFGARRTERQKGEQHETRIWNS